MCAKLSVNVLVSVIVVAAVAEYSSIGEVIVMKTVVVYN